MPFLRNSPAISQVMHKFDLCLFIFSYVLFDVMMPTKQIRPILIYLLRSF